MECEQVGYRALRDDHNWWLADEFRARKTILFHERAILVRRQARADRKPWSDRGSLF